MADAGNDHQFLDDGENGLYYVFGAFAGNTQNKIRRFIESHGGELATNIGDEALKRVILSPALWEQTAAAVPQMLKNIKKANKTNEEALFKEAEEDDAEDKFADEAEITKNKKKRRDAIDQHAYRVWLLPLQWLLESIEAKELLDEKDFDYEFVDNEKRDARAKELAMERRRNGGKSKYGRGGRRRAEKEEELKRIDREEQEDAKKAEAARATAVALPTNSLFDCSNHVPAPHLSSMPIQKPLLSRAGVKPYGPGNQQTTLVALFAANTSAPGVTTVPKAPGAPAPAVAPHSFSGQSVVNNLKRSPSLDQSTKTIRALLHKSSNTGSPSSNAGPTKPSHGGHVLAKHGMSSSPGGFGGTILHGKAKPTFKPFVQVPRLKSKSKLSYTVPSVKGELKAVTPAPPSDIIISDSEEEDGPPAQRKRYA